MRDSTARTGVRVVALLTLVVMCGAWGVVHSLPSGAPHAPPPVRSLEVASVAIDGPQLPLAQLRATLETRVGAPIDTAQLERDRAALHAWLTRRGYLAARVGSPHVTLGAAGAHVVFDVERGRMFQLRNIALEGPGWERAGVVTLGAGDEAQADRLERARQALEDTLARTGAPLRVELATRIDEAALAVDVVLVTSRAHAPTP